MGYLLDTNIVSLAARKNSKILQKIDGINLRKKTIFISCITYFEVRRGFLAVDSPRQRTEFEEFCQVYPILFLDDLAIL
nr:hypothetical protein [Spirulina subsalsa]